MKLIFSATASLLACFGAGTADAAQLSLLKKALGLKVRKDSKPLVTQTNAFETAEKACCACFRSKYAWPANAGLGAAFAPKQTCDTCYVTDLYGIDAKAAIVFQVPKPKPDPAAPLDHCANLCDMISDAPGCGYTVTEADGSSATKHEVGPGACDRLLATPAFVEGMTEGKMEACEHHTIRYICPTACKVNGCGAAADGAYEKTESKVEEVHEWNWNCASGNAPVDPAQWLAGPVEGEPESTRAPFHMCKEDVGWSCPFDDGEDMKLQAGADTPVEDPNGDGAISVATMTLPVIDGAQTIAASASSR